MHKEASGLQWMAWTPSIHHPYLLGISPTRILGLNLSLSKPLGIQTSQGKDKPQCYHNPQAGTSSSSTGLDLLFCLDELSGNHQLDLERKAQVAAPALDGPGWPRAWVKLIKLSATSCLWSCLSLESPC